MCPSLWWIWHITVTWRLQPHGCIKNVLLRSKCKVITFFNFIAYLSPNPSFYIHSKIPANLQTAIKKKEPLYQKNGKFSSPKTRLLLVLLPAFVGMTLSSVKNARFQVRYLSWQGPCFMSQKRDQSKLKSHSKVRDNELLIICGRPKLCKKI